MCILHMFWAEQVRDLRPHAGVRAWVRALHFPLSHSFSHTNPKVLVRSSAVTRSIGRCVTDDFTHWEKETPGGKGPCPTVFHVDLQDPAGNLDIYTNAWTPYPSIESPAVHLFFPSMCPLRTPYVQWAHPDSCMQALHTYKLSIHTNLPYK